MEKIKLLLYCNKSKPYLIGRKDAPYKYYLDKGGKDSVMDARDFIHNGKIVAECDFEVEYFSYRLFECLTHNYLDLLKKSCLTDKEMYDYLNGKNGYAIHIKNLNIFDKPRELSDYWKKGERVKIAPQNMILVQNIYEDKVAISLKEVKTIKVEEKVLISIRPEWLCKILNGEKTIELRKKVLKEMVK